MIDQNSATLLLLGLGIIASFGCAAYAYRLHDNIWHDRRNWAPRLGIASIVLLAASLGGGVILLK
ncbi:MAG TPA: hypothetical protein VIM48_02485 [Chthoniobacterales bacterium]|jgi:hypothetical protein